MYVKTAHSLVRPPDVEIREQVVTLLRGIRDRPATYGLDQAASTVAGAFVNTQG